MRAPDAVHAPLIADVAVREPEPRLPVVRLLGDDTVETDVAVSEITHAVLPDSHSEAFAAKSGLHDVETDEAKAVVIGDGGEARDRLAAPSADEEAGRIRFPETVRVVPAGVPPFRSRPFDRHGHLAGRHGAHDKVFASIHGSPQSRLGRLPPRVTENASGKRLQAGTGQLTEQAVQSCPKPRQPIGPS